MAITIEQASMGFIKTRFIYIKYTDRAVNGIFINISDGNTPIFWKNHLNIEFPSSPLPVFEQSKVL